MFIRLFVCLSVFLSDTVILGPCLISFQNQYSLDVGTEYASQSDGRLVD